MSTRSDEEAAESAKMVIDGLLSLELLSINNVACEIMNSAAFHEAIKAIALTKPFEGIFAQAFNLVGLLQTASEYRLARARGAPYPSLYEFYGQTAEAYEAAAQLVAKAALILRATRDTLYVADVINIAKDLREEAEWLGKKPPVVSPDAVAKRGPSKSVRQEIIRVLAERIPDGVPHRLAVIRDLVRLIGFKCESQNVRSALEYRSRT